MQKITPFLWFDDNAEQAIEHHVSIFKNSQVLNMNRRGPEGPVISATFELEGQRFMALNGGPHDSFTPAISLFVDCETQAGGAVSEIGILGAGSEHRRTTTGA